MRRLGDAVARLFAGVLPVIAAAALFSTAATARPYFGDEDFIYRQPDGSSFAVRLYGDEFFAYQRTTDGREVVLDTATKFWCYARLSADGRSFESTGVPVTAVASGGKAAVAPSAAAPAWQSLPQDAVIERIQAAQRRALVDEKGRPLAQRAAWDPKNAGPESAPPGGTTLGNFTGLCLLVDFPDQPGEITPAQVDALCNQPSGYTEYGNACSVNEYFRIQSNGRFNYNNTVTAYVRMPKPKTYYDNNQDDGTKPRELVTTALDILMAQGFDFTRLSRDASGYIRAMNIFYAGECASGWSLGLWPHSWNINPKLVDAANGIFASRYQMSDMGAEMYIGTFCHENGHMVCGYPDLYSYLNGSSIVGRYSLMAASGSTHPGHVDPYLKMKSGWADIQEVGSATHAYGLLQEDRNFFYKHTNPANSREYFLVENRHNTGYEGPYGGGTSAVAPGLGLAVWHVYEDGSNTYSSIQGGGTYDVPYEAFIIEATPGGESPWYSDVTPYPDTQDTFNSMQGTSLLNSGSTPELRFWNMNSYSGRTINSSLTLHTFGAAGPAFSFVIGSGSPSTAPAIGATQRSISANCDYGTDPADGRFYIFNSGGGTLNHTITDDAEWLSCLPASGALSGGQKAQITFHCAAAALTAGSRTATITVSSTDGLAAPVTIPVTLVVAARPSLSVSPAQISASVWPDRRDESAFVRVTNTGGGTMRYTVTSPQPWIIPSAASGTCGGETDLIYVGMDATGFTPGTHTGTLVVTAAGAAVPSATVQVSMTVKEGIEMVAPNGGENWLTGAVQQILWDGGAGQNVRLELLRGGVVAGVIVENEANDGAYVWTIPQDLPAAQDYKIRVTTMDGVHTDTSDAAFSLNKAIYTADMTTNPGWTLDGLWAWGRPQGAYGDPSTGHTGDKVMGYNLSGKYPDSMSTAHWATTPPFDCSNFSRVRVRFYRWLGVEEAEYDKAQIRVSNGNGWVSVWANPDAASITDSGWVLCEYDISGTADGMSNVRLLWGMGPTDESVAYCGWNIDDVVVYGDDSGAATVAVPDVVNLAQDAAATALTGAGLAVGEITWSYSSTVPAGHVISQQPAAGVMVYPGSAVSLLLSKGVEIVTVPNVTGRSRSTAQEMLDEAGLATGMITQEYSAVVPVNRVMSQDPVAGAEVPAETAVELVVSKGPEPLQVPDVTGMTQSAAQAAVTAAGLTPGTVTQAYSPTVPAGIVISQNPEAGALAPPGSAVSLVVSKGPQPVSVPNLAGMTLAAAQSALTGLGLAAGTITETYSTTVAAGVVISQLPVAGNQVAPGSAVNLVVSKGPQPATVPDVVNALQSVARSMLLSARLAVGDVTEEFSSTVAAGHVVGQDPAAGTELPPGSAVNLVVSLGARPVMVPDVVEETQSAAQSALTGVGLVVGTVTQAYSSAVASGRVISQNPEARSEVSVGSAVNLVVSRGPQPVSVPNLSGQTQTAAQTTLAGAGLVAGVVSRQCSDTVAQGRVAAQNPQPGGTVAPGTMVAMTLSTGPCAVETEGEGEGEDVVEGEGEPVAEGEGETPPEPELAAAARALYDNFQSADANLDLSLSYAEAGRTAPGLGQAQFNTLDANGDQMLSQAELEAYLEPDDGAAGCSCTKSAPGLGTLKKRLGDLFLLGLGMVALAVFRRSG